jgi:hypothetical protein
VTLGGVTTHQIIAAYVDLLAYTVLLANVALVCSVIFHRGGTAAACTTLLMVIYGVAPKIAGLELNRLGIPTGSRSAGSNNWQLMTLEWIRDGSVFDQLNNVMQTGFNEPIFTRQVISNIVVGVVCFALAWILFGPRVNNAVPGGATRGILLKSTTRVKFLSPGRCWGNPFAWKDFQFIGGGYSFLVGKLLVYVGLFAAITLIALSPNNWVGVMLSDSPVVYFQLMLGIVVLEACVSASRIFHDEIRLQTMSSLLMLPKSIPYIGYSKAIGCLLGLMPALGCLTASAMFLPSMSEVTAVGILLDPRVWAAVMTFLIFLHLVALLSLFVRWGALPAAIFLMGPVSVCCPVWQLLFIAIAPGPNGLTDTWGKLPATITVWILTGLVCFVFQMMIAARLQELGTK